MTGTELAEARLALGLVQIDLAKHLNVSRRTVIRWERGHTPVPKYMAAHMRALAHPTQGARLFEVLVLAEERRREARKIDLRIRSVREKWKRPTY